MANPAEKSPVSGNDHQEKREGGKKYQMIINGVLESFDSLDDLRAYVESLEN